MAAMLKKLLSVSAVALLTFTTFAISAQVRSDHPSSYVVQRGDTLWGIAGKFLQKPWLWPEIWQANPQIENPHLIYPGDVISLAYLQGRPSIQPGPRTEALIDAIPLSEVESFLRRLQVVEDFRSMPYVVGLEEDRLRSAGGQVAYVRGLEGARAGDRFTVVRPMQRYALAERRNGSRQGRSVDLTFRGDPDLQRSWWMDGGSRGDGEFLGYELMELAIGQVTRTATDGHEVATLLLTGEGREIREGDRLMPVNPKPFDLQFFPHPPRGLPTEPGRAQVLAVADGMHGAGPRYVVALSVGARDGIDNGTVVSLWHPGENKPDRVSSRNPFTQRANSVQLPDEFNGHAMVFRTFDRVSYALVMESIRPTRVGDQAKHPDATR